MGGVGEGSVGNEYIQYSCMKLSKNKNQITLKI